MKKLASVLLCICMMLTMFTVPTFAATSKTLTTAEQNIVKAYQKTIETKDAKYINKYKYSGVTFEVGDLEGVSVKILNPKYSKVYDSKVKMYKLCINGILVVTDGEMLGITKTPSEIYVKTKNKKLYAYEEVSNSNPTMLTVEDLSESETLAVEKYLTSLYDEDTANALMYPEDEDTSDDEGIGEPDSNIDSDDDGDSSADGVGTLESPIGLNQKYTWSWTDDWLGDEISGTYSVTVKSAKKISVAEINKLGFKVPAADDDIDYVLADIKFEVKDAKIKKIKGDGYGYMSSCWGFEMYGTSTADTRYIGGYEAHFDGGIGQAAYDACKDMDKITPGMVGSYKAEGKAIFTVQKNKSNYMVIENKGIKYTDSNWDNRFIHFKLN